MRRVAASIDVGAVGVFVLVGRHSHHHGESVAGVFSTAWPFLTGLAVGWASLARRPGSGLALRDGVVAWLATVVIGMVLRVVAGQGTALAFIVVALCFLGATMLGGRVVAGALGRGRAQSATR